MTNQIMTISLDHDQHTALANGLMLLIKRAEEEGETQHLEFYTKLWEEKFMIFNYDGRE